MLRDFELLQKWKIIYSSTNWFLIFADMLIRDFTVNQNVPKSRIHRVMLSYQWKQNFGSHACSTVVLTVSLQNFQKNRPSSKNPTSKMAVPVFESQNFENFAIFSKIKIDPRISNNDTTMNLNLCDSILSVPDSF